jgi:hypothetical protein
MTTNEITLTSSAGVFNGNSLLMIPHLKERRLLSRQFLRASAIWKEHTLYIKTLIPNEKLKTTEELMKEWKKKSKKKKD